MIPAPFEYVRAGSVEEAVAALTADPDAKLLAGGHSLLPACGFASCGSRPWSTSVGSRICPTCVRTATRSRSAR